MAIAAVMLGDFGGKRCRTGFHHFKCRATCSRQPDCAATVVLRRAAGFAARAGESRRRYHCRLHPEFRDDLHFGRIADRLSAAAGGF